eukprot:NODE_2264_length_1164_cov_117.147982_g1877_i0.p2 GENE.NODE_2264_length_1164_cov_117.147982_g1877_i0~~NODE_2264_length_1164_cov_117.147982_g1877_i0.p2  ORF type:complete len:356 (+),score=97.98 NODE_2264_length_1164_cov_117.147982_g1877_i0:26-1069(+)
MGSHFVLVAFCALLFCYCALFLCSCPRSAKMFRAVALSAHGVAGVTRPAFAATRATPFRSIFFGKMDNTSLEVVFRSMMRQEHVQRFLNNYMGKHMYPQSQEFLKGKGPLRCAPPAAISDPHRVLRLFSCLDHPCVGMDGKQEVWFPDGHEDRPHHSHGPLADYWKKRASEKQHQLQDAMLQRGHAYEGDDDYPFPSEQDRGHALFWCEHYKIKVVHAEAITYLAEQLLKTLGREATPRAADDLIDELYEGVNEQLLEEWRCIPQRTFDELMFYRPTVTKQMLEYNQASQANTQVYGGPYGSWSKMFELMTPKRDNLDVLQPEYMFVNPPINDEALRQPDATKQHLY